MRRSLLLGRLLFGGVFVCAAVQHMLAHQSLTAAVASQNVPYPEVAVALSTLLLGLGGTSIILGFVPRVGLGLIMLFLVPATYLMHAYWGAPDQAARNVQLAMFMKNVALLGACCGMFAIATPWPLSLDSWLENKDHRLGGNALVRGWRQLGAGAKRTLQGLRPHSRANAESAPRTTSPLQTESLSQNELRPVSNGSGSYVVRYWSTYNADGGVIVRSIRSYLVW